jgi:tyrosine-protein phosphatase SIW14
MIPHFLAVDMEGEMINRSTKSFLGSLILAVVVAAVAVAQTSPDPKAFPNVKIENFGQMDERFYRGARPEPGQFAQLKELGISTVIDLSDKPRAYEKQELDALSIKYIYLPIKDKGYPPAETVAAFLKIVDDPETGKFFVHCGGGKHRTGNMGAVYRFEKYGWDFDKAYREMKNYDFYSSWGHGKQKDFVVDYARIYSEKRAAATAATAAGAGTIQ